VVDDQVESRLRDDVNQLGKHLRIKTKNKVNIYTYLYLNLYIDTSIYLYIYKRLGLGYPLDLRPENWDDVNQLRKHLRAKTRNRPVLVLL